MRDKSLTLFDVADIIMLEFCKSVGGLEKGTPYIEDAYRKAGLNLYAPTCEQIEQAIENLAGLERELFDDETVSKNKKKRLELLESVG